MNDLWSYFILLLIAQGVFTLSVLLVSPLKRKKMENWYLMAIVLVFIWYLLEFYCIRNTIKIPVNAFYGTRYGSWLLLGPLTFFYFKSITTKWSFTARDYFHFLPFVLFVLVLPWLSNESLSNRQVHYGMLAVFDHRPKTVTPFEYLYSTLFYFQFIHLGTYLVFNHLRVISYTKSIKATHSNQNNTVWLFVFNGLLLLTLLLASIFLYILFTSDVYSRILDYIYVVPMGLFIYAIGYKLSGVQWVKPMQINGRYQSSTLKMEEKKRLGLRLGEIMSAEKPYLNNELRLKDLAELLPTSAHHLSQIINERFNLSFFDYINQFRVEEAKEIISQNPDFTLLKVAFEAGFNNKTSFVNAFKKFEHSTPSKYRRSILPMEKG